MANRLASLARKIHVKDNDYSPSSTRCNARYRPLKVTSGTSKPEEKYVQNGKEVKKQILVLEEGFGSVLKIVTNLFPLWVAIGCIIALKKPEAVSWFQGGYVTGGLSLTMLGMGLTLTFDDFKYAVQKPLAVLTGVFLQYTIMPLLGYCIGTHLLNLPTTATVGLILVACCPGGTASNLVTYIARANVALSVLLTTISTLAAAVMTPFLTQALVGTLVPVNTVEMFKTTLQMVVFPIVAGILLNTTFPKQVKMIAPFCPVVAVAAVSMICAAVVAQNAAEVLSVGPSVLVAVMLLHLGGFTLGFALSKLFGFSESDSRTISIEVGMQNSALGAVLATQHFSPVTAVPCAISATCHSCIGSLLAGLWRLQDAYNARKTSSGEVVYKFNAD